MGMLVRTPKYTRPPEMDATNAAIAEREARANAEEMRQKKQLAARRIAMRRGSMSGLISPDRENALLGVPTAMTQEETIRNPYNMTTQRGPTV